VSILVNIIKGMAESLKQSGKRIKEYIIDDTVNDIKKTMQNLEPNTKRVDNSNEKE